MAPHAGIEILSLRAHESGLEARPAPDAGRLVAEAEDLSVELEDDLGVQPYRARVRHGKRPLRLGEAAKELLVPLLELVGPLKNLPFLFRCGRSAGNRRSGRDGLRAEFDAALVDLPCGSLVVLNLFSRVQHGHSGPT